MFMDVEVENPPDTLRRSDVATVDVLFYLVSTVFQSCTVRSFMNIFETILDSVKGRDAFDVSMAMILSGKERIVRDNPGVIDWNVANS